MKSSKIIICFALNEISRGHNLDRDDSILLYLLDDYSKFTSRNQQNAINFTPSNTLPPNNQINQVDCKLIRNESASPIVLLYSNCALILQHQPTIL